MSRMLFCAWIAASATSAFGQETPPAETEQSVVIKDTGGESEDAKQPKLDQVEQAIVQETNAFRKEHGRKPLTVDEELTRATESFAEYMARTGKYGHTADGQKAAERVTDAGYEHCIVRENIAYAFRTQGFSTDELADQFMSGWKESPGHRRNLLARWITGIGVAVAKSEETDTYFAVQVFGQPESATITFEIVNKSEATVGYQLSGRDYTVEPRVIRTHKACTPEEVLFLSPLQKREASHPRRAVARVTPEDDDRMVITPAENGRYQVTVKGKEAPSKKTVSGGGR